MERSSLGDRKVTLRKNETKSARSLTYKDVVDILEVIDHSARGELNLELEDLKLTVVKKERHSLPAEARLLEVHNLRHPGIATRNSDTQDTGDPRIGR
jgi:hypothetical protein